MYHLIAQLLKMGIGFFKDRATAESRMGFGGSHVPQVAPTLRISHGLEENADVAHVNFGDEATAVGSNVM